MMESHDNKMQLLERALSEVYRRREENSFRQIDVTQTVMRDIRRSASEKSGWMPAVVLDQLVWRTATIAAAIVLVMTVLTVGMFRTTAGESAWLLAEEFESAPLFGDY